MSQSSSVGVSGVVPDPEPPPPTGTEGAATMSVAFTSIDWFALSVMWKSTGYVPTSVGVHVKVGAFAGALEFSAHPGVAPTARTVYGAAPPEIEMVRVVDAPRTIELLENEAVAVSFATTVTTLCEVPLWPSVSLAQTFAVKVPALT
jgi:hypothetical protein